MSERIEFVSNLTEDLFTLAKLEDGDMTISFSKVDLSEIVKATVGAEAIEASEKNITITSIVEEGCFVWGNADRLRQIAQNLIANAVYYTHEGGDVHIVLQTAASDGTYPETRFQDRQNKIEQSDGFSSTSEEAGWYELRISDTGPGIDTADINKIFTKYYRAANNGKKGATGLGLAIAHNLVERHRGVIRVESQKGVGSTFIVQLPRLST